MSAFDPVPTAFNMAAYVLGQAERLHDKPALEILYPDRSDVWNYGQLDHAVRHFAARLRAAGVTTGDQILLRMGNTANFPIAFLGCIAIDALPVPLSTQLAGPEVVKIKAEITPKLTLSDDPETGELHPPPCQQQSR